MDPGTLWEMPNSNPGTICRRRIKTEEKAMVVVAVWETELFQFLAALATLHQDNL